MKKWMLLVGLVGASCTPSGVDVKDEPTESFEAGVGVEVDAGADTASDGGSDGDSPPSTESDGGLDASSTDGAARDAGTDGSQAAVCYRDVDGDGVGAGEPVPCSSPGEASDASVDGSVADAGSDAAVEPRLVEGDGDCDDADPSRAPTFDELCDDVDNDCDDEVDEQGTLNACGGTCVRPLDYEPGESCTNQLLGACLRTGTYVCTSTASVACDAPMPQGSDERCGDSVDNDCDGAVDEADAIDAATWYQDCDGDGFAPSTSGSRKSCVEPEATTSCKNWVSVIPVQGSTRDCDDTLKEYAPNSTFGVPPMPGGSNDLNCDGTVEKATYGSYVTSDGTRRDVRFCSSTTECPPFEQGSCMIFLNSSGNPTTTKPRCSTSAADKFKVQTKYEFLSCAEFDSEAVMPCR